MDRKITPNLTIVVFIIFCVGLGILEFLFKISNSFYLSYVNNHASINSCVISFFAILFGFLLTSFSIIISQNGTSFFSKIIKKNAKYKKEMAGVYVAGMILSLIVSGVTLMLTIFHSESMSNLYIIFCKSLFLLILVTLFQIFLTLVVFFGMIYSD